MSQFEVDPDSLTAAATVGSRQSGHLANIDGYVGSACSHFGAFTGVLSFFAGQYQEAVETARTGLRNGQTVGDKVHTSFQGCRDDYLASDRMAYTVFDRAFSDVVNLDPYEAPGSGSSIPATGGPPAGPGKEGADPKPYELPKAPDWVNKPFDTVVPGPEGHQPFTPFQHAKDYARTEVGDRFNHWQYEQMRADGVPAADAYGRAYGDSNHHASEYVRGKIDERASQNGWDAYYDAKQNGASHEDAMEARNQAYSESRGADAVERRQREDILGAAGSYKGAYDGINDAIKNGQDIYHGGEQFVDTTNDIDDYDDFENRADDDSNENWGNS